MKVTIIGASTSGLFAAYLLAREGVEVEVFERRHVVSTPSRTLIVTNRINDAIGFIPEEAVVNRVRYLEICSRSRSARLELKEPDLVMERERLVNLLLRLASGSGAKINLGHQFEGFIQSGSKIVVRLKDLGTGVNRPVSTDILIGADGAMSRVSRAAWRDGHSLTSLLQVRVAMPESIAPDTCQVWFDSNQTKYFYWLIPESRELATVGLIANDDLQARMSLETFLKERKLEPLEFQAATVPLHRFRYISDGQVDRNVFLVGDAAAQVKTTTVGGVVTGLRGARALANALLNGRNYRKELRGLKRELDLHLLVREVLNRFRDENYDELIGMLKGRLKGVLEEWSRDELRNGFFKLILAEPRLISLCAKAFLRSIIWDPYRS
jgi:flavin-dependent dehydrogenase